MQAPLKSSRIQSFGEEMANTASHAVGLLLAAIGAPVVLAAAAQTQSRLFALGTLVFAATTLLLYLGSTLYHAWPPTRMKSVLRAVDHSAIFLLIAGTYTPFTLGPLRGVWGWSIFAAIWLLAAAGVFLKTRRGTDRHPKLALALYLGMGWLIIVAIQPLWAAISVATFLWLLAGGILYTIGVLFFVRDWLRYRHFVWHLFVLGGTSCHFFAVLSCTV